MKYKGFWLQPKKLWNTTLKKLQNFAYKLQTSKLQENIGYKNDYNKLQFNKL